MLELFAEGAALQDLGRGGKLGPGTGQDLVGERVDAKRGRNREFRNDVDRPVSGDGPVVNAEVSFHLGVDLNRVVVVVAVVAFRVFAAVPEHKLAQTSRHLLEKKLR